MARIQAGYPRLSLAGEGERDEEGSCSRFNPCALPHHPRDYYANWFGIGSPLAGVGKHRLAPRFFHSLLPSSFPCPNAKIVSSGWKERRREGGRRICLSLFFPFLFFFLIRNSPVYILDKGFSLSFFLLLSKILLSKVKEKKSLELKIEFKNSKKEGD